MSSKEEKDMEADEKAKEAQMMKEFPPLEKEHIDKCKAATLEDIAEVDKTVIEGMDLFFNNHFREAEDLFASHFQEDCLIANGWGTLGTIRAMLSMEPQDIDAACKRLVFASHFGYKVIPQRGALSSMATSIGNWWYSRKPEKLLPSDFRANVIIGESELLRANLLLMEDTLTGYVKAGWALRRAYNIYDYLQKYIAHYPDDHGLDANSINGMHFGLGAIHVVTSILPPKILGFLKALGYMHDRKKGFDHLHKCLTSRTLRSPIASLFLLAFHGMLPAFATLTAEVNIPIAEEVIQETLAMYPKSVIHLWIAGRVDRLKHNVTGSIDTFTRCVGHSATLAESLPQLKHFAQYDLAWSYIGKQQWDEARQNFKILEEESVWSKKFYLYAQACCFDQMGRHAEAEKCYERSIQQKSIKLGGKTISVDQFVKRRLELVFRMRKAVDGERSDASPRRNRTESINVTKQPGMELAMLFNVLTQMEDEDLQAFLAATDATLQAGIEKYGFDEHPLATKSAPAPPPLTPQTSVASPQPEGTAQQQDGVEESSDNDDSDIDPLSSEELEQVRFEELQIYGLMRSTLQRELKDFEGAENGYNYVQKPSLTTGHKASNETWLAPHAFYENAVLQWRKGEREKAGKLMEKLKAKYNGMDYNFEMQMQFRCHLTQDLLRQDAK